MSALRVVRVDIITTCTLGLMVSMRGSAVVAVEFGHLDVEQHHVRVVLGDHLQGDAPVGGRSHQGEPGLADPAGDQAPDHGGIVGHQDPDRRGGPGRYSGLAACAAVRPRGSGP